MSSRHVTDPGATDRIRIPVGGRTYFITRGLCLFFGLFSLLNVASTLVGSGVNQNIWWIDLSLISLDVAGTVVHLGFVVEAVAAVLMVLWALRPACWLPRRLLTCLFVGLLAAFALVNAFTYWRTLGSSNLYWASPIPLSLVIAVVHIVIVLRIGWSNPARNHIKRGFFGTICVAIVAALVFPLLQITFFGTTDYRRDADAAVVLGARVFSDGRLSNALAERMDTAIDLYKDGYVPRLIVSGGIEEGGIDEAQAMYDYAVANGVKAKDLLIDRYGDSTEATVNNTIKLMGEYDVDTLIATSSFYHMPRIKMLFNLKKVDVLTVPTIGEITNNGTLASLWREIPAWWVYWLKGLF